MNEILISQLVPGEIATIAALHCGSGFKNSLRSVGVTEGKKVRMVAKHPFSGPLVLEVERRQVTIGRGMSQKIKVVKIP